LRDLTIDEAAPLASTLPSTTPSADGSPRPRSAGRVPRPLRSRLRAPLVTSLLVQAVLVLGDRMPAVDAMSYFETGRNVLAGRGYVRQGAPEMHFPPVAPLGLAVLERLTGSEMAALRTWNLAWGMAFVVLLTVLAHRLTRDDDVVVTTAWLALLVPGGVALALEGGAGSELATVTLVLTSALLVLVRFDPDHPPSSRVRSLAIPAAGAAIGLAYLARPESLMPGATIGLGATLIALRIRDRPLPDRSWRAIRTGAAFGFAGLVFVAPYLVFQHAQTGSWSLTSKSQDASIDAWRAVAEGDRHERDQVLYAIQPDGTSLGPETVPLTALAREHPRGWLTIAWTNTTEMFHLFTAAPFPYGPVWELIPLFVLAAALWQLWTTRRQRATLLLASVAAWPLLTCFVFFALPRYLMLATATLIPFGAWGLVRAIRPRRRPVRAAAWSAVWLLTMVSFLVAAWPLVPGSGHAERTEQQTAGRWLAENTPDDARIMTRSFHVQGYSEREVVAMPYADYLSTLDYARRMGVSYLVADEATIRYRRPAVFEPLVLRDEAPAGLELVHEFTERRMTVRIFRLDPLPAPSPHPPVPLGYVSN
jgi:hypothetical protein